MPKRIDTPDTVDTAVHFLHRWQADGWGITGIDTTIEYAKPSKKSVRLPVAAVITVRLEPS